MLGRFYWRKFMLTFIRKQFGKAAFCLLAVFITVFTTAPVFAQANPSYSAGGQANNLLTTSPSLATFNGTTYIAYGFNGVLYVAASPDGVSWNSGVNTGFATAVSDPAIAAFNNQLYVIFPTTTGFQETSSPDGVNWSSPVGVIINSSTGYNYSFGHPGLAVFNNNLYLSFIASTPTNPSPTIQVASAPPTTPSFFSGVSVPAAQYNTNSGSSMTIFNGRLWVSFTEGPSNLPVLASSGDGVNWTSTVDTGFELGGDPSLVVFAAGGGAPALYIFGRSNFSENNLWVTGTYDGVNFSPAFQYGQSLHLSVASTIGASGQLVNAFHSNFSSTHLWSYTATN